MTDWSDQEAKAERRARIATTTPEQRLGWLRRAQEAAKESGAWERALRKKRENTWKYGK